MIAPVNAHIRRSASCASAVDIFDPRGQEQQLDPSLRQICPLLAVKQSVAVKNEGKGDAPVVELLQNLGSLRVGRVADYIIDIGLFKGEKVHALRYVRKAHIVVFAQHLDIFALLSVKGA